MMILSSQVLSKSGSAATRIPFPPQGKSWWKREAPNLQTFTISHYQLCCFTSKAFSCPSPFHMGLKKKSCHSTGFSGLKGLYFLKSTTSSSIQQHHFNNSVNERGFTCVLWQVCVLHLCTKGHLHEGRTSHGPLFLQHGRAHSSW